MNKFLTFMTILIGLITAFGCGVCFTLDYIYGLITAQETADFWAKVFGV